MKGQVTHMGDKLLIHSSVACITVNTMATTLMVTCQADISHVTIKLSQYSTILTRIHFEATKDVMRYLKHTINNDGIHYWHKEPRED